MKYARILAGLLMLLLPISADAGLYEIVRKITEQEVLLKEKSTRGIESLVTDFITKVFEFPTGPIQKDEVDKALSTGKWDELCAESEDRDFLAQGQCGIVAGEITTLALREERIRTLGRDLQLSAASFELSVDGYPGRTVNLPTRYTSISRLWEAGTESAIKKGSLSRLPIRFASMPDNLEEKFETLKTALTDLNPEEMTAAVWRYRYGVRYTRGDRPEYKPPKARAGDGPGTERQYLSKRWNAVEDALLAIRTSLPGIDELDPPLTADEIMIFQVPDEYKKLLPENLLLWAYHEKSKSDGAVGPSGDIGLQWILPSEPVLPSLLADDDDSKGITGSSYPPPPEDGTGLCSFPFARLGYLCREIEGTASECASMNGEIAPEDKDKIILTRCQTGGAAYSEAGPNICRDTLWRNPATDPGAEKCKNCSVRIECKEKCSDRGEAITKMKEADGTTPICIPQDSSIGRYLIMHELVHAQQSCNFPPGTVRSPTKETCCSIEREAYAVQCNAMWDDGIFEGTTNTVDRCIGNGMNSSCEEKFGKCIDDVERLSKEDYEKIVKNSLAAGEKGVTCQQAISDKMEPRVQALLDGLLTVSTPECEVRYANTIGNNMCYIGQAIEESLEMHSLVPGRITLGANEEFSPWQACAAPDPMLGSVLTPPAARDTRFPEYKPAELLKQLDTAYCQANGLPPLTPSFLCEFQPTRRLHLPLQSLFETAGGLLNQTQEFLSPADGIQKISDGLAARMGTSLYSDYIETAGRTLGDITGLAATLLKDLTKITFSTDMCPRDGSTVNALCSNSSSSQ